MKIITYKPGTILLWKDYSSIRRWFDKLLGRREKYNRGIILRSNIVLCFPITQENPLSREQTLALEPVKDYTKQEVKELQGLQIFDANSMLDTLKITANIIRPGSIDVSSTFDDLLQNKEYKVIYDSSKKN